MQQLFAIAILLGWVPLAVVLFATMPARRALLVSLVVGWLFLPTIGIDLPGLPAFYKDTSVCLGALLGMLLFDPRPFLALRPRWFDLPIALFCLSPFATSISNDLGPYDGMSEVFGQVSSWMLPYLIGRAYFTEAEHLRGLETAIVASAIVLAPLCVVEMAFGSKLQLALYGTGSWEGVRDGFYRPKIFFRSGLTLGMWMYLACLSCWWLWRSRLLSSLRGLPAGGVVLPFLVAISVLCRATGATLLAMLGAGVLWWSARARNSLAAWGLAALAVTYCSARITGVWSGDTFVALAESFISAERAQSLGYRLFEEDMLMSKAMQRPLLGWGGYARSRMIDFGPAGGGVKLLGTVDSLWSITFGSRGLVGLASLGAVMLLPSVLFFARVPARRWGDPDHAPTAVMAVFLVLFVLDCLANAMLDPIFLIALGGVTNVAMARPRPRAAAEHDGRRAAPPAPAGLSTRAAGHRPREGLAARYQESGRAAKSEGRPGDARDAWERALELWRDPRTGRFTSPLGAHRWCECANDLAWLLAETTDPAVQAPGRAVALALETIAARPERAEHWNTLGAAHYRAGAPAAAIAALERSVELAEGGGPFDHLFLAMANARIGHEELARLWAEQAAETIDRDHPGHRELRLLLEEARAVLSSGPGAGAGPAAPLRQLEAH